MKRFLFSRLVSNGSNPCAYGKSGAVLLALLFSANAAGQSSATLDEMERHLEEQRIALEQTIAERDAMGKEVQEVKDELEESQKLEQELRAQMELLCKEQAELAGDSAEECLNKLDN